MDIRELYGFQIYKDWFCKLRLEQLAIEGGHLNLDPESRINELAKRISLKGFRVLELGCLEGSHSSMLQALGAKEVIAIEGRIENFLKCLIVKNALSLDKCKFLLGDLNDILPVLSGPFGLCFASGILYHLENPVSVLSRVAQLTDNLFVWTHYAVRDDPHGPIIEMDYQGCVYRGKHVKEDLQNCLSGLHQNSFRMLEDDMLTMVRNVGFKKIEVIRKENHKGSPAITFLARK
ncbi:MAG: DUF1698 domain-containing protein [Candidatus Omnitrophota bacterium]